MVSYKLGYPVLFLQVLAFNRVYLIFRFCLLTHRAYWCAGLQGCPAGLTGTAPRTTWSAGQAPAGDIIRHSFRFSVPNCKSADLSLIAPTPSPTSIASIQTLVTLPDYIAINL